MTKEVKIYIKAVHTGSESEEIAEEVQGTYYEKNGSYYVFYEMKEDETRSIPHMLKCKENHIVLTKKYEFPVVMEFIKDETTRTLYRTPYGNIPLEVKTTDLSVLSEEHKLLLGFHYELTTDGAEVSRCKMKILVESR